MIYPNTEPQAADSDNVLLGKILQKTSGGGGGGSVGPQGPAGPAGATGPQGPAGDSTSTSLWRTNEQSAFSEGVVYTAGAYKLLVVVSVDLYAEASSGAYAQARFTIVQSGVTTYYDMYATSTESRDLFGVANGYAGGHVIAPLTFIVEPGGTYELQFFLVGPSSSANVLSGVASRSEF